VTVSNSLRRYLGSAYGIDDSRVSVIPCCTDDEQFRWSGNRRQSERTRLNLTDKFVCTHLGSLFEWYQPETLVQVFGAIRQSVPSAHLLIVTRDVDKATSYLTLHLRSDLFTITEAKHQDVPALLNASDLGLLLLPDTPNIQASSPTKFSEYLNCGLPVLISPRVGDYSELVEASDIGEVAIPNRPISADFLSALVDSRDAYAARCVRVGAMLTWKRHTGTWNDIVKRLEGG